MMLTREVLAQSYGAPVWSLTGCDRGHRCGEEPDLAPYLENRNGREWLRALRCRVEAFLGVDWEQSLRTPCLSFGGWTSFGTGVAEDY